MSAHVTIESADRLRSGKLPPKDLAVIGHHIATCDACREILLSAARVESVAEDIWIQLEAHDAESHLSDDDAAAFVDDALDPKVRTRFLDHLQACDVCSEAVDDLRFLSSKRRKRRAPRQRWWIAAAAAAIALIAGGLLLFRQPPPNLLPSQHLPIPAKAAAPSSARAVSQATPPLDYGREEWNRWVADAIDSGVLTTPAVLSELQRNVTQLRGSVADDPIRLMPNAVVIEETRPQFEWTPKEGATYTVLLSDGTTVVEESTGAHPSWQPAKPLLRGAEYQWQVEISLDGTRELHPLSPRSPARFRILEARGAAELSEARRRFSSDHLLMAVLLARNGLRDSAIVELERLRRTRPALAERLLRSLNPHT